MKKLTNNLTPELSSFAYDVVHGQDEIKLVFGEGSDVCHRVWFGWTGTQFDIAVETHYFQGTIKAFYLTPSENIWHVSEDRYVLTKLSDVVQTLYREHGIKLQEAVE